MQRACQDGERKRNPEKLNSLPGFKCSGSGIPVGFDERHEAIPLGILRRFAVERIVIRRPDLLREIRSDLMKMVEHGLTVPLTRPVITDDGIEVELMKTDGIAHRIPRNSLRRFRKDSDNL